MESSVAGCLQTSAPLISPRDLTIELPPSKKAWETIESSRAVIRQIITGHDRKFLVIVGPCSIHDPDAALEYAQRLRNLKKKLGATLFIVMRVYLEKPRSSIGWKGLINDPHLDNSYDIAEGLRIGRKLLLAINEMGIPTAMEILDPIVSYYIGDLASWVAIGARTVESQIHRQMASGLAVPIGFKNGTCGALESAVNSILASQAPHHFLGIDRNGNAAVIRTIGNRYTHLVLRGGTQGPNYDHHNIQKARAQLLQQKASDAIVVDCSHMNSGKVYYNQPQVWRDVVTQRVNGERSLVGVMAESNIYAGNQCIAPNNARLRYGVSVTDQCMGWDTTEELIIETNTILEKGNH